MHEVVVERRHQIKVADALGCYQRERTSGIELRHADEGAADQRHRQQRAHAHGVVERHDAERALAASVRFCARWAMAAARSAGHALRPRRRARGVEHQRPGVGFDARRRIGRLGRGELRKVEVGSIGDRDRNARQMSGPFGAYDRRGGDILVGDGAGFGILDVKVDLVILGAPVDGGDNDSGELAGPMNGGGLPIVLQHGDEMVAGLEPDFVESGNERGNLAEPFPLGQTLRAVDNCERIGIAHYARDKKLVPRSSTLFILAPRPYGVHDRSYAGAVAGPHAETVDDASVLRCFKPMK